MFKLSVLYIDYYFSSIENYKQALMVLSESHDTPANMIQMADAIIDNRNNKVLKCRYMLSDIFDKFYLATSPMVVCE